MIKKRTVTWLAFAALAVFMTTTSCYKSATVDLSSDLEITRDISFKGDLIPIFEKSCAVNGCHAKNGIVPDLSTDAAFTSLTTSDYLDLGSPDQSELYGLVSGKLSPVMPLGGTADPVTAATILAWIKQGAQNN